MDPAMAIEAAALAQQRPMLEAMDRARGDSDVQRFYKNSVLFLTGGSGFLGKQLLEKLFRACQISKVYLLLRQKKGKDIKTRIQEMVRDPLFDTLRKQKPDFVDRISGVEGDVSEIRLGIKDDDWKMITEEVDVMFHGAATTRFDESLRTATIINVRGTREALLLGKACKKLRSYVHVSTAYTNATTCLVGQEVQEEFYGSPIAPKALISMAETMESHRLIDITPTLTKDWPNTYSFTKAVSEELVRDMSVGLPICIVRPGIVLCAYREPTPGWMDKSCVFGASGFVYGAGLGVLHTAYTKPDTTLGIVPCDYVTNAIIAAARETATSQAKGGNHTRIYTVTSTQRNHLSWKELYVVIERQGRSLASPKSIYYCFGKDTSSKFIYMCMCIFLQFIPAYIADFICILIGKKRRFVKLAHKVYKMCNVLSFFTTHDWKFIDNNTEKLYFNLSEQDQAIFNFNISDIDWREFALIWCVGIRKYIILDGLQGTESGVKKQKYLRVFNYIFMSLYIYCIYKIVYLVYFCLTQVLLTLKSF